MKVALIQPPVRDFYDTDIRLQPTGLLYIKAAIKKYLPEVEVIVKDCHSGHGRRTVPVPEELAYLREYYPAADKSPFSTFHQYYHFGQSFDAIEAEVVDLAPDLVGISSMFTPYHREAIEVARRIKKRLHAPVIMGGPHVSALPEFVLADPCVDYVVIGEGERSMVEFVNYLLGRKRLEDVPGLGHKKDGMIRFNPVGENYPVDELPVPDTDDLPPGRYQIAGKPLSFIITSRGCPFRCSFCSVHTTFGNTYRRRSVENVIREIRQRYREGFRVIDFEDDNLSFNKDEFRKLCGRLIEMFPEKEMEFTAMNGISYMSLDEDILELMSRAGFSHLNISLVSSDRGVHKTSKRPYSPDIYTRVVEKAFQSGIRTVSYQILGLPDESVDSMVATLAFNARLPLLLGPSPFYLIPKSPVAEGMKFTEADYVKARLTALGPESGAVRREEIYSLFITTRIINFLKGLAVPESTDITGLLQMTWNDHRDRIGVELLKDLWTYSALYLWTSKGKVPNIKFRPELFARVIREAGHITCQNGKRISVSKT